MLTATYLSINNIRRMNKKRIITRKPIILNSSKRLRYSYKIYLNDYTALESKVIPVTDYQSHE